ncbi:hypothetical protein Dimus_027616 [Dionaea muscipula]
MNGALVGSIFFYNGRLPSSNFPLFYLTKKREWTVHNFNTKLVLWLAWRNRLLCGERLVKLYIIRNPEEAMCCFCSDDLESVNHLLFLCPEVRKVWLVRVARVVEGRLGIGELL